MPQRQLGTTLAPDYVGTVVIGDGTRFTTRLVASYAIAKRLAQRWLWRSQQPGGGGTYNATIVPVYADGTVAGGNAAAKTFLQGRTRRQLAGVNGRGIQQARLLRT